MSGISYVTKTLKSIDNLPTLSSVATQLLELLGQPDISMNQISQIVAIDPVITAQILKISNSAFYSIRSEIDTVQRALVVLGVNEITNIILSLSLFKTFPTSINNEFDKKTFWYHSAVVAYLSKFLANRFKVQTHGEEFTAGLMHDIGKVVIDQYFHDDLINIISLISEKHMPAYRAETKIIGVGHNSIGHWIGAKWKIPEHLLDPVLYHHHPDKSTKAKQLSALVNIADLLAHKFDVHQKYCLCNQNPYQTSGWRILEINPEELNIQDFELDVSKEIENAGEFISVAFKGF